MIKPNPECMVCTGHDKSHYDIAWLRGLGFFLGDAQLNYCPECGWSLTDKHYDEDDDDCYNTDGDCLLSK